jgi:cytochrome c5
LCIDAGRLRQERNRRTGRAACFGSGCRSCRTGTGGAGRYRSQQSGWRKTFKSVCSMCHQSGAAGAPIVGNKDDWSPRIAQGKDTLYKHALEGFSGQKGAMPAKGGSPSLSDADVKAAVDFMVAKAS